MNLHLSRAGVVVLAVAALTASAMTGAVADRLITGDDIKNHTIERQDLADDAVGNRVVRDGSIGLAKLGPGVQKRLAAAGTPGPAGAPGPAGVAGAPGLSGYEVVETTETVTVGTPVRSTCPSGKRVVGGGFWVLAGPTTGAGSGPTQDGLAWEAVTGNPMGGNTTIQVRAICAKVS